MKIEHCDECFAQTLCDIECNIFDHFQFVRVYLTGNYFSYILWHLSVYSMYTHTVYKDDKFR